MNNTISCTNDPRPMFIRAVPVAVSQRNPPLQPPVTHEFGPEPAEKLHSVLPHILPAVQSYGTANDTVAPEACSQPVGWDGTDFPILRSVYRAGLGNFSACSSGGHGMSPYQIVKGQWFTTVKIRNDPEPRFPETGLEAGVEDVEVGFSDDVAVAARTAIWRLREQTFILVERMKMSKLCYLNLSLNLTASYLEPAAPPSTDRAKPGGKLSY